MTDQRAYLNDGGTQTSEEARERDDDQERSGRRADQHRGAWLVQSLHLSRHAVVHDTTRSLASTRPRMGPQELPPLTEREGTTLTAPPLRKRLRPVPAAGIHSWK